MNTLLKTTTGLLLAGLSLAAPQTAFAQKKPAQAARKPATSANALAAIKESDIKRDVFALAGDHFRGREGGTLDEPEGLRVAGRPDSGHWPAAGRRRRHLFSVV
ncbi:hypothetical protein ACFQT0_12505 [Hymenobacter humi]|uniref:Uncharacterized protein n=1 Tax=Hymenobacter humi TaxID=1411620 RepID=A0ABW2U5L0_9BACT